MKNMKLAEALDKIAALEKRIEELEKRQPVVINNYPPPVPTPATIGVPYIPQPYVPAWPHDTIITCENPRGAGMCVGGVSPFIFN